nr:hypothetical protein [Tanacetum cinerariifolium]
AELHDSRVPVPNPDLLRYTYCWRRILTGRGSKSEDMLRRHGLGTYTDDQIMVMVRGGKQHGHIPNLQSQHESESGSWSAAAGDDEPGDDKNADEDEKDANG